MTTHTPREPGVIFHSGHQVGPATDPDAIPEGGGYVLAESAFGQPYAPYILRTSTNDLNGTYGDEVTAAVRGVLYPDPGASKSEVENGGAAFRYKQLLYAPTDVNGETRTVADFGGIENWFGAAESNQVNTQIASIVAGLTANPLHTGLRHTLLDAYTDRAVAEMQFNKRDLVELGKKRLGLLQDGKFIIDEEIKLLTNVVHRLEGMLARYAELLARPMEGVEPSDFDARVPANTPFGYYIFETEQPARNANAPLYFTDGKRTLASVPDFDPILKEIPRASSAEAFIDANDNGFYDAGESFTDANENGIYDGGSVMFNGFKDYTTLLRVMGEYAKRSAELARYYGMRRASGDLAKARDIITGLQRDTATEFSLIRNMYAGVDFPAGDASGVRAAIGGVERAFADSVNVRAFLQGRGNILGLDENFMVFLQDGSGVADTFDQMRPLVYDSGSPTSPVQAALEEQARARVAYENFRASVDQVVQELGEVEDTYQERFQAITGYPATEAGDFNGQLPKPDVPSELATLDRTLQSLLRRQETLGLISRRFIDDIAGANNAVGLAEGIGGNIASAQQRYLDGTASAYVEMHIWAGTAAGVQAGADATIAAAASPNLFAGVAIGAAGAANAGTQAAAATRTSMREQELDQAAIGFESSLAQAELPLTIQQTRLELGGVVREQYASLLELEDNNNAIAQALADRTRLLREVESIRQSFAENQSSIRSRFYADPLHLVRSDNAILKADAAFANAQRWMFYLQRSLEYKWNQNFVGSYAGRDYDSGSLFKLRNAAELKDLATALDNFNSIGRLGFSQNTDQFTVISLRDYLSPDPLVLHPTPTNTTVRIDRQAAQVVTQTELFRRRLRSLVDINGNIVIPINTTRLSEVDHPSFFVPPRYNLDGSIISKGRWHDVVRFLKVNIVDSSHQGSTPQAIGGQIVYSGMTFFRTRVAPRGQPSLRLANTPDLRDIPGELIATPFRHYTQPNLSIPYFETTDFRSEQLSFARSADSVMNLPVVPGKEDPLPDSYRFNGFTEYSVAATGWRLVILSGAQNPTPYVFSHPNLDIDQLEDIEFIVAHRSAVREQAN